ncbi:hypothetical protein AAF712_016440, partial [Marasmius tenuissimus]
MLTFHIVSTVILFLLATISAITLTVQTSAAMGEWTTVNVVASSIVLFVTVQLLSLTALIILVYRCYCIYNRSLKIIALPVLLILIETVAYYVEFKLMIEQIFASNDATGKKVMQESLLITSSISVSCEIVGNLILTSAIAAKIWLSMRNLEVATGGHYRPSYNHIIAIMVESGVILLLFYAVFAVFIVDNGADSAKWTIAMSVMAAVVPQIS